VRSAAKVLLLASLLALKPACGGGGGGAAANPGTGASMPPLPALIAPAPAAAGLPGGATPLAPDVSGTLHVVDLSVPMTDLQIRDAIQAFMNGGGRITFNTGGARTVVIATPLHVDFGSPAIIVDGGGRSLSMETSGAGCSRWATRRA